MFGPLWIVGEEAWTSIASLAVKSADREVGGTTTVRRASGELITELDPCPGKTLSWYRVSCGGTARYSAIQRDTARYRDPAIYYDLCRYVIFYDSAISNNTGQCANTQYGIFH